MELVVALVTSGSTHVVWSWMIGVLALTRGSVEPWSGVRSGNWALVEAIDWLVLEEENAVAYSWYLVAGDMARNTDV